MEVFSCKVWLERQHPGQIFCFLKQFCTVCLIQWDVSVLVTSSFILLLQAFAGRNPYSTTMTQFIPAKKKREIKEDDLQLEPLCAEVLDFTILYFVQCFFSSKLWMCSAIAPWVRYCSCHEKNLLHLLNISHLISYIWMYDSFTRNKGFFSRGLTPTLLVDDLEIFY